MSYVDDLIDLNEFQGDICYTEVDNNDRNKDVWTNIKHDSLSDIRGWSNEYDTERSGMAKLVSSEEDIISISGSSSLKHLNEDTQLSKGWHQETFLELGDLNLNENHIDSNDGFASDDVLTVGEEFSLGCPGTNQSASMAEQFFNTEYDTILRANTVNGTSSPNEISLGSLTRNHNSHKRTTVKDSLCSACDKKVYITEILVVNKRIYHNQCFKCFKCQGKLGLQNFGIISNQPFCRTHYLVMFNQKGKYDDLSSDNLPADRKSIVESEDKDAEEQPPRQITRIQVEKFRQLESSNDAELLRPRGKICFSRTSSCPSQTGIVDVTFVNSLQMEDERVSSEMPPPGTAKCLLDHWNSLTSGHVNHTVPANVPKMDITDDMSMLHETAIYKKEVAFHNQIFKDSHSPRMNDSDHQDFGMYSQLPSTTTSNIGIYTASSLYEEQSDGFRNGNVKSNQSEIYLLDELPEEGITRNLVGFFQSMQ